MPYHELRQSFEREHNQLDTLEEVLRNEFNLPQEAINRGLEEISHYTEYEPSLFAHGEYDEELEEYEEQGPSEDEVQEKVYEYISSAVLEISTLTVKKVLLGCGGPTEYIEITFDSECHAISGEYTNTSIEGGYKLTYSLSFDEIQTIVDRYCLDCEV